MAFPVGFESFDKGARVFQERDHGYTVAITEDERIFASPDGETFFELDRRYQCSNSLAIEDGDVKTCSAGIPGDLARVDFVIPSFGASNQCFVDCGEYPYRHELAELSALDGYALLTQARFFGHPSDTYEISQVFRLEDGRFIAIAGNKYPANEGDRRERIFIGTLGAMREVHTIGVNFSPSGDKLLNTAEGTLVIRPGSGDSFYHDVYSDETAIRHGKNISMTDDANDMRKRELQRELPLNSYYPQYEFVCRPSPKE